MLSVSERDSRLIGMRMDEGIGRVGPGKKPDRQERIGEDPTFSLFDFVPW